MIDTPSSGAPRSCVEVGAPTRDDALRLSRELTRCDAQVVQTGTTERVVRALPRQQDGRTLNETLTSVERWLRDIGLPATAVVVGGRSFTLDAAPRPLFAAKTP